MIGLAPLLLLGVIGLVVYLVSRHSPGGADPTDEISVVGPRPPL